MRIVQPDAAARMKGKTKGKIRKQETTIFAHQLEPGRLENKKGVEMGQKTLIRKTCRSDDGNVAKKTAFQTEERNCMVGMAQNEMSENLLLI